MCGGVRGVGAGGIVSTAYCLLYKLFTLKLTRKQLNGLVTHCDSPYIRALGFMYIRYTQPPQSLLDWYEPYLDDTEELDVKAGGGQMMKIGVMLRQWLVKLEWFSTLFPRIPVPIQQKINKEMQERFPPVPHAATVQNNHDRYERPTGGEPREWDRSERDREREKKRERDYGRERERDRDRSWDQRDYRDKDYDRERLKERERIRERSPQRERERERERGDRERERDRDRERHHRSNRDADYYRDREYSSKETHRSSKYERERDKYRK